MGELDPKFDVQAAAAGAAAAVAAATQRVTLPASLARAPTSAGELIPAVALRGGDPGVQVKGLRSRGLRQQLQSEGVIRGQINDARADNIEEFTPTFDKSDVLKPIQRSTEQLSASAAPAAITTITILAPRDQILVVRQLEWFIDGDLPDTAQIRFRGGQNPTVVLPFLQEGGPFPVSGLIVGDVRSPMTELFQQLLPISILPFGRIEFTLNIAPAGNMEHSIGFLQEVHYSPFRPAGL